MFWWVGSGNGFLTGQHFLGNWCSVMEHNCYSYPGEIDPYGCSGGGVMN